MKDIVFLLLTGLLAAYLCWYFYQRYQLHKALHNLYYLMGFAVLLVSGLLLIVFGLGILSSPYVLTVASLIPLGVSMGLAEEYFPAWKKYFKWFAALGFLAIAVTSIGGMDLLKKIAVPLFHGVAGLVIFIGPFYAKGAPKGFFWVGIGGLLIGLGGIALAFITLGKQLLFFSPEFVTLILTPLLFLMTGAYVLGFAKRA
ncbi:MAG TPA: hypothetical protein PKE35_07605 [Anaerolineales bacterium]|nr:hypothetical protein [Anaerolineales bacterium]HMV96039.1 hypothetical protein [Anaerolineales bacterium]HMX18624.1 hypothetical protein [Anaerolineales bacterium]HMX74102.1 hypothetical protein [Anaerolineales bacterium]HMZ42259.1 hypothetical protein [Anaerolineales bacterium]